MIKYILMLLLVTGVASPFIGAQETTKYFEKDRLPTHGWVYLSDGTLINGVITKDNGSQLTLTNKHFTKRRINYEDIEKTAKGDKLVSPAGKGRFHFNEGVSLTGFISFNVAGESRTGSWQGSLNYRINKSWIVGAGGAFDWYRASFADITNESLLFYNSFVHGRYNLTHSRARVYLYSRVGYGIGLDGNFFTEVYSNGWNFQPGIGVTLASTHSLRWIVELGMATQRVNGEYVIRDPLTSRDFTANYVSFLIRPLFKIGFEFH